MFYMVRVQRGLDRVKTFLVKAQSVGNAAIFCDRELSDDNITNIDELIIDGYYEA